MRAFSKIFGKCKKRKHLLLTTNPIVSHLEPEPATSTSIMMASAVQSVPTGSANVSTQDIQPTGITVSVQLETDHDYSNIVVDQTAQLGVSASVSTLAIHDIVSVIRVEEHEPSVSHLQLYFLALINDKQNRNFQSVPADSATSDQVTQPAGVTVSIQLGPIIITETLLLIRLPNLESPLCFPLRRLMILLAQKKVAMHCPYCNTWNIRG